MRRVLLASLPLVTILVIGASFFLLNKHRLDQQSLLKVSQAAAFTVKTPVSPRLPAKPMVKVTPIIHSTPTPSTESSPTPIKSSPTPSPTTKPVLTKPTPTPTRSPVKPTVTTLGLADKVQTHATPSPVPTTTSGDTVKNYIMKRINEYRASVGLESVSTDSNTCDFARTRASEITQNFNHDGFTNRLNNHTLPYPAYHEVSENIAMNSDYKQIVTMWINSAGHAENMRKDTPYVCVEKSGNFYAYEGWKP